MKSTPGKLNLQLEKLIADPKRLFLIDGSGALLTTFLLVVILARFREVFGMPQKVVYLLSLVPFIYAVYSFCCYFFSRFFSYNRWQVTLKAISIANIFYCCITIGLVFYFYQSLTTIGLLYFLGEVMIIACLVRMELLALSKL